MKQLKVFYLFAAILIVGMLFSCDNINNGGEDDNGSSSSGSNNLKSGQIEMKVYPDKNNRVSFHATTQKITIDWGDGSIDELTPNNVERTFTHEYPNRNLKTIKVNTQGMIEFYIGLGYYYESESGTLHELKFGNCPDLKEITCGAYGALTVLDVSKCTALTYLDCYGNPLTSLDVSKCANLTYLDCGCNLFTALVDITKCKSLTFLGYNANQLSASALNSLFSSLPTRKPEDEAKICCGENPGYDTCDKTIAEKKGWKVQYRYDE